MIQLQSAAKRGHLRTQKASELLMAAAALPLIPPESLQRSSGPLSTPCYCMGMYCRSTMYVCQHHGSRASWLFFINIIKRRLAHSPNLRHVRPQNQGLVTYCWARVPQSLAAPVNNNWHQLYISNKYGTRYRHGQHWPVNPNTAHDFLDI